MLNSRNANTAGVYDRVTIGLHWLVAGLVLFLWLIGEFLEVLIPRGPLWGTFWSLHVAAGFLLTIAIVLLTVWRFTKGRQLPAAAPGPLHLLAKATHLALYGLLLAIIALGISNAVVRGISLFGVVSLPRLGNRDYRFPLTYWHGIAANILMIAALFHASAALLHHYLWRDGVLRRMVPAMRPTSVEPVPYRQNEPAT